MGLDMYLHARKYISKNDYSDRENVKVNSDFNVMTSLAPEGLTKYSDFGGITVSYPVGYWRKANAIHGWFIDECAGGVDECQDIYVPRDKLVELRDLCKSAVSQPAMAGEILPPVQGFFFGSYEIDEYYVQDLNDTIKIIDHILSVVPEDNWEWEFIYRASW
jgi:hypothetical protein